jgi:hypothetical protein
VGSSAGVQETVGRSKPPRGDPLSPSSNRRAAGVGLLVNMYAVVAPVRVTVNDITLTVLAPATTTGSTNSTGTTAPASIFANCGAMKKTEAAEEDRGHERELEPERVGSVPQILRNEMDPDIGGIFPPRANTTICSSIQTAAGADRLRPGSLHSPTKHTVSGNCDGLNV